MRWVRLTSSSLSNSADKKEVNSNLTQAFHFSITQKTKSIINVFLATAEVREIKLGKREHDESPREYRYEFRPEVMSKIMR